MSNYDTITTTYQEKTGRKIWPTQLYIKITGDPLLGLLLDRVVWWSDKGARHDGFFWKTTGEWEEELSLSYAQVRRLEKKLSEMGLIEAKKFMANGSMTMHYRPNIEVIINKVIDITNLEKVEVQESRSSRKSNHQLQESRSSELQESRSSITGITKKDIKDDMPTRDPLEDIVRLQGRVTEETAPNPDDQWITYGKTAADQYAQKFGIKLNLEQRSEIGLLCGRPGFSKKVYGEYLTKFALHGGYQYDVGQFIAGYWVYARSKDIYAAMGRKGPSENGNHQLASTTRDTTRSPDEIKRLLAERNRNSEDP